VALRSDVEKRPFLDERRQVEHISEGWALMAYLSGAVALVAPPTVVFSAPIGVVCACFAYVFKKRKADCDAIIDDPPRSDFRTASRAQRDWFEPRRLEGLLSEAQISLCERMAEGDGLLRAAVRADERAQGAYLAGDLNAADWQGLASDQFLDAFASLQPETATQADHVFSEIVRDPDWTAMRAARLPRRRVPARRLDELLDPVALRALASARLTTRALRDIKLPARAPTRPFGAVVAELTAYRNELPARAERLRSQPRPAPLERLAQYGSPESPRSTRPDDA
jgi:hypothetical protein